tara:strand:- start:26 stop:1225 length:1200 start_codon:yes stop_codon:yes gene_type:complete
MGFFSRIFRTVKKAIKKPITKIFKGVGKGIAKVAKSTIKGIKQLGGKAFQAYGKISKKLGPIGMIGVSMAMPYLLGAFGATGGGLWTGFGKVAEAGSLSTNPFLKVLGHVGKGTYNAGNFIGGTYKGITQTIGQTFKGFASGDMSQGFKNLYQGTTEVLSGKAGMGTTKLAQYSGSQIMQPVYNANTLTQTGGVSLGNANVANSFYRDSVAAAMQKNALFTSMEGDTLKYFNSTKKYFPGLDDKSAFEYIQNNGAFNDGGVLKLDYSASGDFTALGPPNEFTFTGDNISKTIDTYKINTNLGTVNKIADGDAFEMPGTESGGILSKGNVTKAAIETAKNWLASDNNTQQSLLTGGGNRLNVVSGAYDGTNVTKAAGGSLLTEELQQGIEGTTFNIAGSR